MARVPRIRKLVRYFNAAWSRIGISRCSWIMSKIVSCRSSRIHYVRWHRVSGQTVGNKAHWQIKGNLCDRHDEHSASFDWLVTARQHNDNSYVVVGIHSYYCISYQDKHNSAFLSVVLLQDACSSNALQCLSFSACGPLTTLYHSIRRGPVISVLYRTTVLAQVRYSYNMMLDSAGQMKPHQ